MEIIRRGTTEKLSRSVQYGHTVYLSGILPTDLTQDIDVQTASILEAVKLALAQAGSSERRLLFAQIFLKRREDAAAFNRRWNQWLPAGCAPARICVEANMLNDNVLVELCAVAAAGEAADA